MPETTEVQVVIEADLSAFNKAMTGWVSNPEVGASLRSTSRNGQVSYKAQCASCGLAIYFSPQAEQWWHLRTGALHCYGNGYRALPDLSIPSDPPPAMAIDMELCVSLIAGHYQDEPDAYALNEGPYQLRQQRRRILGL